MPASQDPILIARGERDVAILPHMANRHGLIAVATGTGKTVTNPDRRRTPAWQAIGPAR
jgi:uncharacterized protein